MSVNVNELAILSQDLRLLYVEDEAIDRQGTLKHLHNFLAAL